MATLTKYIWQQASGADDDIVQSLVDAFDIPRVGARMLAARDLVTPEQAGEYLFSDQEPPHDPFLFNNMEAAVTAVKKAIAEKRKVLVHGDYDVDGISGTAMLYKYLDGLVPDVFRFVPDRRKDGYGLADRSVQWAIANEVGLFIAVDCGTSDGELINQLQAANIDVIVCDHHELPADRSPQGILLNPVDPNEAYPYKGLCGTGVAYKLICALDERGIPGATHPELLLDLVALATVGDVAPLTDENRHFVRAGLRLLSDNHRPGLRALRENARMDAPTVSAWHIGFMLAPRLNAPGRVANPKPALEILCVDNLADAKRLARQLEVNNDYRKELTEKVKTEVMQLIRDMTDADQRGGFVLAGEGWDEGVLGIAAARVVEDFGKPTILITTSDGVAKGSGRSVPGVHLKEQLDHVGNHLSRFGGHAAAVGFSLETSEVERFAEALTLQLTGAMKDLPQSPTLRIDTDVELAECTPELLEFLAICEPFGHGNRTPIWKISNVKIAPGTRYVGSGHLRLIFEDDGKRKGSAISFGWEERCGIAPEALHGKRVDLAVTIKKGYYQQKHTLDMHLRDMREHEVA